MIMMVELVLACTALKKKWRGMALLPFVLAGVFTFLVKAIEMETEGGVSALSSGYFLLFHLATISTLLYMTFRHPKSVQEKIR